MTNPDEDAATSAAGGTAGLEGYLYQATVSTWVALELVLNQRLAVELVLEPVTHEDIEAAVANPEAAELDSQLQVSFPLHIQIKQRSTMNWTVAGLNELLTKPRKRRKSPVENLENPTLHYLLITNASVDGVACGLVTRQLGVFPAANDMPVSLAGALPDAAGRVGVMPLIDDERLTERIERLLIRRFKVPVARVDACRLALDGQALERMRRPGGGVWSRAELEQLVADHDGLPSSATRADRFVPPTNFDDFVHILDTQHAIILTGPSGTGKTSTAEALLRHLRAGADGFEFMVVEGGPEKIRSRRPNGPIVFMVEDPWGRVRADPRAEPWNEAIIGMLAKASPQRKFIITSRSDVLADAQPPSLPRSMMALLEGYHYPTAQKRSLFDNRLAALPRDLQSDVDKTRADIVRDVSTPAEIERYFWLLANDRQPNEELWGFVRRCIATAKSGSVDAALLSNVRQRNDHRWAILTWGLFKASRKLSYATIGQVQEELDAIDPVYFDGVTDYLGFLVAGRHLHQTGAVLSYTHPLVEKGLQSVVDEKSSLAKRVLADLFAALLALKDENWGLESAANLLGAMIRTGLGTRHVTQAVQSGLDVWLVQRLTTLGPDFEDDLDLAATVGSRANAPPEIRLARWLTNKGDDWAAPWEEPEGLDAADYVAMAAAPAAAAICGAFVRRILGQGGAHYPLAFVDGIARISPGIATDFVATARALVTDGVNSGLDVVLEGARRDLTGFAAVADQAIAYVDSRDGAGAAFLLAEANGEYDGETANTISEDYGQETYSAEAIIGVYVTQVRGQMGWEALRDHARVDVLLHDWIRLVRRGGARRGEIESLLEVARNGPREAEAWQAAGSCWIPALQSRLEARLVDDDLEFRTRLALIALASRRRPGLDAYDAGRRLAARASPTRLLQIAVDIVEAQRPTRRYPRHALNLVTLRRMAQAMPEPESSAFKLLAFEPAIVRPERQSAALALLSSLGVPADPATAFRLARILSGGGLDITVLLTAVLSSRPLLSDEAVARAAEAVDLAADLGRWALVEDALDHPFADAVERALRRLAARSSGGLPPRLLALTAVRYGGVKFALLDILRSRRLLEHQAPLITLTGDLWSNHTPQYDEEPNYPIAQRAADTLAEGPRLEAAFAAALMDRVRLTDDPELRIRILTTLLSNARDQYADAVIALAVQAQKAVLTIAACKALLRGAHKVSEALAARIPDQVLANWPAEFAADLIEVVGACAAHDRVLSSARALAAIPDRRALLLPLYVRASRRDPELGRAILELLDDASVADRMAEAGRGERVMARDALHSVGATRITDELLRRFPTLFAPKPPSPPPPIRSFPKRKTGAGLDNAI